MSVQFELALRKYIAAFNGTRNISTDEFKSRFDNLHHKYFTYELRSKDHLTREQVFQSEAIKLVKGTKVTLISLQEVGLGCVDIKLRLEKGKKETIVRVVSVIDANKIVASREVKESARLKTKGEVESKGDAMRLSLLTHMIKNQEWDLVSNALTPDNLQSAQDDLGDGNGSLLHLALKYDAPSSIISQITDGISMSVSHPDAEGRLPLHVAIRKARASVISHLLALNPKACTSSDCQGETPLHSCFDENVKRKLRHRFSGIVRTLVHTSPEPLLMEDKEDRCPIEVAILSGAPLNTILFMHREKNKVRRKGLHRAVYI